MEVKTEVTLASTLNMAFFKWRMFNFFNLSKDVDEGAIKKSLEVW